MNGPDFVPNGIIIHMLLVMEFCKGTHQKVYLSVQRV